MRKIQKTKRPKLGNLLETTQIEVLSTMHFLFLFVVCRDDISLMSGLGKIEKEDTCTLLSSPRWHYCLSKRVIIVKSHDGPLSHPFAPQPPPEVIPFPLIILWRPQCCRFRGIFLTIAFVCFKIPFARFMCPPQVCPVGGWVKGGRGAGCGRLWVNTLKEKKTPNKNNEPFIGYRLAATIVWTFRNKMTGFVD